MFKVPDLNKTFKVSKNTQRGSFALYFQINKTKGIKIIEFDSQDQEISYRSEKHLFKSESWKRVSVEFEAMKRLEKTRIAPRAYKMVSVYNTKTKSWLAGIIMEHIDGKMICDAKGLKFKTRSGIRMDVSKNNYLGVELDLSSSIKLSKIMSKYRVYHNDIHDQNLMVKNGKLIVIDFGLARIY